jgi:hypothetical protein
MESTYNTLAFCCILVLFLSLVACNQDSGNNNNVQQLSTTLPVSPSVSIAGPKRLHFTWNDVGANHYRLLKNPDGNSGYSIVHEHITTTSVDEDIAVHLIDWRNISYMVQACDINNLCVDSTPLTITGLMLDAIGSLRSEYNFDVDFPPYIFDSSINRNSFGHTLAISGDGSVLAVGDAHDDVFTRGINGTPDEFQYHGTDSGAVFLYTRGDEEWSLQAFVKASNVAGGDQFGTAVSLSRDGTILAVGAPFEDSGATGINGDQTDNSLQNTGAVYIFSFDGSSWNELAYIKIRNSAQGNNQLGLLLSLSSMGDRLCVLSRDNVYVFHHTASGWIEEVRLNMSELELGSPPAYTVQLSGDGLTLAIGTPLESTSEDETVHHGVVYIYTFNGTEWIEQGRITANHPDDNDYFGASVSLSEDGNVLAVGASREDSAAIGINGDATDNSATSSGAAYLFEREGGVWNQSVYLKASNAEDDDYFGNRVALSGNAQFLVVAATGEDSLARGINGDQTNNASAEAPPGAVYLYARDRADWYQKAYIKAPNTNSGFNYELGPVCRVSGCTLNNDFGSTLAISDDGTALVVGATRENNYRTGAVYLY